MNVKEKLNICIIDDNIEEAEDCKCILETAGNFDFSIQIDSSLALEYINLNQENIDLIILDLNMPKIDGIQVIEYMNTNNISIPVIIYSSYLNSYTNRINKKNIIDSIDKNIIDEQFSDKIMEIFIKLNMMKSCMVIDKNIKKMIKQEKNKTRILDSLNEVKRKISILAESL